MHRATIYGYAGYGTFLGVIRPKFDNRAVPSNPTMSLDRGNSPVYTVGETVAFTYSANDARDYTIGIDRNGERILTQGVPAGGFLYKPAQAGTYSAYVTCYNAVGGIDSPKVHFMVVNPAQTYEKVTWSVSGHQYQVIDEALTWTQAQQKAASLGGTLATVTSAAEWEYIVGLLKPTHRLNYWLGGTDSANEGTWAWVTGELWTYSAWTSGEPNGGTAENRLHFFKNADGGAVWNDAGNEENADFGYIVEWEPAVYRVSGTVTSYNPGSATKVTLWRDDGTKNSYNMAIDGVGKRTSPFTFRNVTPGTYTLTVEKDAHTKYTIKDFTVSGDILFDDLTLPCGDINGDNLINQADLNVLWLPGNYNKSAEAAANPLCDLDGDGLINQADLNILWLPGNYNKGGVTVG
ncbi:MAG: hypothetical protein LBR72_00780 [Oscillospiraceae bacterium]|nr:hypothetical protein [Oscillospiraceae bacterium]